MRHLAERVGLDCVDTEKEEGAVVFDVAVDHEKAVTCGSLQGLVVEVETLYGTGTVVHKLVETVERAGGRKMWIVVPNPQAVIYLPLLLRTRRELRKEHDVEFYTLDVTSRGLVRLTDVAGEEMERGGRGLREVQVTCRYTSRNKRLSHPDRHIAYTDVDKCASDLPVPPTSKRNKYLRRSAARVQIQRRIRLRQQLNKRWHSLIRSRLKHLSQVLNN